MNTYTIRKKRTKITSFHSREFENTFKENKVTGNWFLIFMDGTIVF